MASFEVQGLLEDNSLELGMKAPTMAKKRLTPHEVKMQTTQIFALGPRFPEVPRCRAFDAYFPRPISDFQRVPKPGRNPKKEARGSRRRRSVGMRWHMLAHAGTEVRFGPFESPEKRIPLINIVDQLPAGKLFRSQLTYLSQCLTA